MPTVADVVAYLELFAPPSLAAEWDNVGLLLGDPASPVERVLTCLTITPDVVAEATTAGVNLIVTHHPILFRGTKQLVANRGDGSIVWPLARAGIAVYSPHTAFDNCPGGINDILCRRLGILNPQPLRSREAVREFKLVVFVPDSDLAKVSDAIFEAGAGHIGKYEQCSFRVAGQGTFFGNDATNPTVGQKGRREDVNELRLEVVLPEAKLAAVVKAMRTAHSYEEPAFDIYPLKPGTSDGSGRIGELAMPTTLREFANLTKVALNADFLQVVGDAVKPVQKIAVACGAAGEFLSDSIRAKADVFVTGEMRFHDALVARTAGIGVLIPGHYATERPAIEELAAMLASDWPDLTVWASRVERDPISDFG